MPGLNDRIEKSGDASLEEIAQIDKRPDQTTHKETGHIIAEDEANKINVSDAARRSATMAYLKQLQGENGDNTQINPPLQGGQITNDDEKQKPGFLKNLVQKTQEIYFTPRQWEKGIYEILGVKKYRSWLVKSSQGGIFAGTTNPNAYIGSPTVENVKNFEELSKKLEFDHTLVFGTSQIAIGLLSSVGFYFHPALGIVTALAGESLNVATNLYPAMLQRYNRLRIRNIKSRFGKK